MSNDHRPNFISIYLLKFPMVSFKYALTVLISSFKYFNLIEILSFSFCCELTADDFDVEGCKSSASRCLNVHSFSLEFAGSMSRSISRIICSSSVSSVSDKRGSSTSSLVLLWLNDSEASTNIESVMFSTELVRFSSVVLPVAVEMLEMTEELRRTVVGRPTNEARMK